MVNTYIFKVSKENNDYKNYLDKNNWYLITIYKGDLYCSKFLFQNKDLNLNPFIRDVSETGLEKYISQHGFYNLSLERNFAEFASENTFREGSLEKIV